MEQKPKLLRVHVTRGNETLLILDSDLSGDVSASVLRIAAREFIHALGRKKTTLDHQASGASDERSECRAFRP
jgi:hypothetical protein